MLFVRRPGNTADELRRANALVNKITSFISFSLVVGFVLDVKRIALGVDFLKPSVGHLQVLFDNVIAFGLEKGWPLALALVSLIWMLRYKAAARNETEILISCFSPLNPIPPWRALRGSRLIRFLAFALTFTFLILAGLVNWIELYAIVVYVWAIGDLLGNSSVQRNLLLYFDDPRYRPLDDDPLKDAVRRRRAVAKEYWIERPQLVRIAIFLTVMGAVIILTGSELTRGIPFKEEAAYLITIIAILGNTSIMAVWRHGRDRNLAEIDDDEKRVLDRRVAR